MSRRRSFTPAFKAQVMLEVLAGAKSPAQACREHGIRGSLLSRWRQEFLSHAPQAFDHGRADSQSEERIAELERLLGRLTMELAIA
ncbi:MAG TPA: IS3 family transposase, partial [Candidatus Fraserbacteria bacterium]|nr:IS3 family transposase [Candidatus Fraserbacteria bacterium]